MILCSLERGEELLYDDLLYGFSIAFQWGIENGSLTIIRNMHGFCTQIHSFQRGVPVLL